MDESLPDAIAQIQAAYRAGRSVFEIVRDLRAAGRDRDLADDVQYALKLNPDCVAYIYAWLRDGISDERLVMLLAWTMPEGAPPEGG